MINKPWPNGKTNLFVKDIRGGYIMIHSVDGSHSMEEVLDSISAEEKEIIDDELWFDYREHPEKLTLENPDIILPEELDPETLFWNGEHYYNKDETGREIAYAPVYAIRTGEPSGLVLFGIVRV